MKKVKRYTIKKKSIDKSKSFWERYKDKIISAPEYKDSVKYIREMRDKE
jgi:hypothetical protein